MKQTVLVLLLSVFILVLFACSKRNAETFREETTKAHIHGCLQSYDNRAKECHATADVVVGSAKPEVVPPTGQQPSKDASMLKTVKGQYGLCYTINSQTGFFIQITCPSELN